MPGKEANAKVKEFAERALALDPDLAEAHMSLGTAHTAVYDWQNSLKEYERALERNPNLAFAYELQAWTLTGLGRTEEAIVRVNKAIELDPLNPFFQWCLSFFQFWAGQYDNAIPQARKTLEMGSSLSDRSRFVRRLLPEDRRHLRRDRRVKASSGAESWRMVSRISRLRLRNVRRPGASRATLARSRRAGERTIC